MGRGCRREVQAIDGMEAQYMSNTQKLTTTNKDSPLTSPATRVVVRRVEVESLFWPLSVQSILLIAPFRQHSVALSLTKRSYITVVSPASYILTEDVFLGLILHRKLCITDIW